MIEKTTRQKLEYFLDTVVLDSTGASITRICQYFDSKQDEQLDTNEVLTHIEHLQKSIRNTDKTLLVKPPKCLECEFSDFDNLINAPSRCPQCRSERIQEPAFTIKS